MRSEELHGDKDISFWHIIVQKGEFYLAHWRSVPTAVAKIVSLVETRYVMKNLLLFTCLAFGCCSCATILNPSHKAMTIYTSSPSKIIIRKDTLQTEGNEAHFLVSRSKEALNLRVVADSSDLSLTVKAKNSFAYYLNILYNYGLGMLIDQNNPKRYTYPRRIFVDPAEGGGFKTYPATQRGDLNFQISFPYINSFITQPFGESRKTSTGFWGLGAGVDYYHKDRQYLSLNARTVSDFFLPILAPVSYVSGQDFMSSSYLSLSNHHRIKRFDWGYGLSWIENRWGVDFIEDNPDSSPPTSRNRKRHQALGLEFSGYYFTGRSFHLGLTYRPSFARLYTDPVLKYEHLISVDLAWKIRL